MPTIMPTKMPTILFLLYQLHEQYLYVFYVYMFYINLCDFQFLELFYIQRKRKKDRKKCLSQRNAYLF